MRMRLSARYLSARTRPPRHSAACPSCDDGGGLCQPHAQDAAFRENQRQREHLFRTATDVRQLHVTDGDQFHVPSTEQRRRFDAQYRMEQLRREVLRFAHNMRRNADAAGYFGDLIVLVGDSGRTGGHGYDRHDVSTILRVLAEHFLIIYVPETYSSQLCCGCLRAVDFLNKRQSLRTKVCLDCPANAGNDYVFDRDFGASLIFYYYMLYTFGSGGELPPVCKRGSVYPPSTGGAEFH